jgi:uncharacterized Zn finger protein
MIQVDPAFLVAWVRAELGSELDSLVRRHGELSEDEAELDAAGLLADRRGLLDSLEKAAGELWLSEVREARGRAEMLERSGPSCVAWLRATPGAAQRLAQLSQALLSEPGKTVAELDGLGGSPGCSTR